MTLLWCGGEDIDFPNGQTPPNVSTGGGFRSGYGRCGVGGTGSGNTNFTRSVSFAGGGVTSAWLHFRTLDQQRSNPSIYCGLGLNSAGNVGLAVGVSNASNSRVALFKYDGTTVTQLAAETGNSLTWNDQIDMQITSYGSSSTVNVYVNGALVITYSGSTAISGVSNLDCVIIGGLNNMHFSEFIVTDTADTRAMSLVTLAPNAAGDSAGSWTNTYTSINPTSINDANAIYNNATGSDFQANLIDLPSGSFSVVGCKAIARAEVTAGATPTGFKLGVKSGGTVNVDAGHTPGAAFAPFERLMTTNPVTSANWTTSDLNALQLDVQSM